MEEKTEEYGALENSGAVPESAGETETPAEDADLPVFLEDCAEIGDDSQPAFPEDDEPAEEPVQNIPDEPYEEEIFSENAVPSEEAAGTRGHSRAAVGLGVANIVIASLTLCAVAAGFLTCGSYISDIKADSEEKQRRIEALEAEKSLLESDYMEAMNIIEEAEPEEPPAPFGDDAQSGKILLYDSAIGYSWVPVLSALPRHTYRKSGFSVDERGRMSYTQDGEASSYFGIDVSSHQGDIDWQLVKEDGVEFAFLRIGYRGYGEEGRLCPDEKFVQNYEAAHDAGIDLGIYFFSQAVTAEEAAEEARFLLTLLDGRTLEYPIVFDWETVATDEDDPPRTEDVMPQTLTLSAAAFCETVQDAGYDAMIYTNKKQAVMKYDLRQLSAYPVWLAYYDTDLNYCYDFDIWQYGTGLVDGISGDVDLNIAMIR